jgi:hypothetical protein
VASRAALIVALVLGLGLAGCGFEDDGGGETSGSRSAKRTKERVGAQFAEPAQKGPVKGKVQVVESSLPPDAQVDLAIKAVLASGVPGLACDRYATKRYVESSFGGHSGCVQSTVPASAATSVEVSEIRIDGKEARAVAVPSGGPSGGEQIRVELVRAEGVWKVDSLRSNAPVGP